MSLQKIKDYVAEYDRKNGHPPKQIEIARELGYGRSYVSQTMHIYKDFFEKYDLYRILYFTK